MFDATYFESLTLELRALKNRVRHLINDAHWQTDGEWKESVLRTFLRRHMPKTVEIGRGFVITNNNPSSQIDILIYDAAKPILFQDGDLVFVTPDAVLGMIEVKSSVDNSSLRDALEKLCNNAELVRSKSGFKKVFGLFSYEDNCTNDIMPVLQELQQTANSRPNRIIDYVCLGESRFVHYWSEDPEDSRRPYHKWHAYKLQQLAPGYFINNIIREICPQSVEQNRTLWYPIDGKESRKIGEIESNRA